MNNIRNVRFRRPDRQIVCTLIAASLTFGLVWSFLTSTSIIHWQSSQVAGSGPTVGACLPQAASRPLA